MRYLRIASLGAALLLTAFGSAAAQTTTAFKVGERTTGMTKQCFYDGLGSLHTITIQAVQICPLSIHVQMRAQQAPTMPVTPSQPSTTAVTGFHTGERVTGMTKQCFYDALGSQYTRTIGSVQLCPISIQVRRVPY